MSSNPFAKNLENVTDPTDWNQSQVPELTELDSLLRCFICKEFLRGPVMTGCNHTFCSQCIREYLITNSHCPLCDSEQYESNLKRVIQLEEAVLCYAKVRSNLLSCLKLPPQEITQNHQEMDSETIKEEIIEIESEEDDKMAPCKESTAIGQEKSSVGEDCRGETPRKRRKTNVGAQLASKDSIPTRDQLVECPVCNKIMSAEILQTNHIDSCLSKSPTDSPKPSGSGNIASFFQSKQTPSHTSITPTNSNNTTNKSAPYKKHSNQDFYFKEAAKHHNDIKKLPKLDFSSLTTPRLKEKLSNLKLPTQGTRTQLELRYNQYYILFNSNLDSSHPVFEKILKQRLNQWELSHLSFTSSLVNTKSSLFDVGSVNPTLKNITDKNFLVSEWLNAYKGEFTRLTKLAKKSVKKKSDEGENCANRDKKEVQEEKEIRALEEENKKELEEEGPIDIGVQVGIPQGETHLQVEQL